MESWWSSYSHHFTISCESLSNMPISAVQEKYKIPYMMKIYTEFNLASLLRLVKFTELNYRIWIFEFQKYKLSLRDFANFNILWRFSLVLPVGIIYPTLNWHKYHKIKSLIFLSLGCACRYLAILTWSVRAYKIMQQFLLCCELWKDCKFSKVLSRWHHTVIWIASFLA